MLGHFLNRMRDFSVKRTVLPYKQLIRPMMYFACPAWRSAARTHVRRLQVLQSKCIGLANGAPWYVRNRHIHEDLGVTLFGEHIRALSVSFDSTLTDVGYHLVWYSADTLTRVWPLRLTRKAKCDRGRQDCRGHCPRWPIWLKKSRSALICRALFITLIEVFRGGFSMPPVCEWFSLGSKPRLPTKQSLSLP